MSLHAGGVSLLLSSGQGRRPGEELRAVHAEGSYPTKSHEGRVILCAPDYCFRYRPAARNSQQVDTGTCHQGFQCIVRANLRDDK